MGIDWDAEVLGPCHETFGEPATFLPNEGGSSDIIGVFFNGFTQDVVLEDGSIGVNSVAPVFAVRSSQFGARPPVRNDSIKIASNGATYVIRDVQPDGVGELRLQLQRSDAL